VKLRDVIRELEEGEEARSLGCVKKSWILEEAERRGIPRDDAEKLLERMHRQGEVFEPRPNCFKLIL